LIKGSEAGGRGVVVVVVLDAIMGTVFSSDDDAANPVVNSEAQAFGMFSIGYRVMAFSNK
jgi:hypothetical protein